MIKQHSAISTWTPDEVAECIEGIGTEVGGRLWSLHKPRPFTEEPVYERQTWWRKLSQQDQEHINACVTAEFGPDNHPDDFSQSNHP